MASSTNRAEGFGERLLGTIIERAHEMPPHLTAPLAAEVIAAIGGRDVAVLLPDYDQLTLVSLPGQGLVVEHRSRSRTAASGMDDDLRGRRFRALLDEHLTPVLAETGKLHDLRANRPGFLDRFLLGRDALSLLDGE